jgi:hypothetical protein
MTHVSKSDQEFIMQTAMLECSISEGIDFDSIFLLESRKNKGTWFIVDCATYADKSAKTKVWFKKTFGAPK